MEHIDLERIDRGRFDAFAYTSDRKSLEPEYCCDFASTEAISLHQKVM